MLRAGVPGLKGGVEYMKGFLRGVAVLRCISRDLGQPTNHTHPHLLASDEVMPGVHKDEFSQRRRRLMELISTTHTGMTHDKHVVIIPGAHVKYMSADVPYRFHQNTDLLYLTGFMEPDAVLVLEGHTLPDHKAVLYVRPRDPHRELWDGPRAGADDAVEFTGVDEAFTLDHLSDHLEHKYSTEGYSVWYSSEEPAHPQHAELITEALTRSPNSRIKDVHNPSADIAKLRLVKSSAEQALMRKAGELAGRAFTATMKATYSGVSEGELESVFEHSVKTNGAQWLAYPPVVAGGTRANCLHYISNDKPVQDGELVLMDAGCEYHGYVSDVTRTWPVNGKFSSAQRDLYEIVRTTKQELTHVSGGEETKVGVTLNSLHAAANGILARQLQSLGVLPHNLSASSLTQAMGTLFPHHVGHYLGMDTHDTMLIARNTVLSPGMVITLEPGIYISRDFPCSSPVAKELLGTGIRLEDNILVTDGTAEVLNKDCPELIEELTSLLTVS